MRRWEFGGATLDPSSDALAYVVAHRARLRQVDVVDVLDNVPHEESLHAYRAHIEAQVDALFFAPIVIDTPLDRAEWHHDLQHALGGDECADADGVDGVDLGQVAEGIELSAPAAV